MSEMPIALACGCCLLVQSSPGNVSFCGIAHKQTCINSTKPKHSLQAAAVKDSGKDKAVGG